LPDAYLYYGDGHGGFSAPRLVDLPGTFDKSDLAIGDLNGDGIPDLVSSAGYIVLGTADGGFTKPLRYAVETVVANYNLALADLRNNGLTDIVTGAYNAISVLLNMGKGKFEDGVPTFINGDANCGATADFNGDGKPDLAVNTVDGVTILLGTGNAASPLATASTIPFAGTGCVVVGDLNGDGIPDLLIPVNGNPNALLAYLGNGDGTFTFKSTTPTPNSGGYVVLADFNQDGKLDLATSGNLLRQRRWHIPNACSLHR
jgi:hypothetical protein